MMIDKIYNFNRNLIVDGKLSAGKTTNVMFPLVEKMIDNSESLFILDSKEEYLNKYYNTLKSNDYNVIIINLRNMDKSEGWNPLEYPYQLYKCGDKDGAIEHIERLAKTIYYKSFNEDPFWSMTAGDLFKGLVLSLFEDGKENEINLTSINSMLDKGMNKFGAKDYLTEYFNDKNPDSKAYTFASTTVLAPNDTKGGILSVAKQRLRLFIGREKLNVLTNKTTFDFNNVLEKKTAIFFIVKDEETSLSRYATMFINQLYTILVSKKLTNKFNFILDNFDLIKECDNLIDMLSSCISRKMKVCICTRDLEALLEKTDKYLLKLSDVLKVDASGIKLISDNGYETIKDNIDEVDVPTYFSEYPKLEESKVNIFDLQRFVINNNIKKFNLDLDTNDFISTEDLIKSIDKKIAELDAENK